MKRQPRPPPSWLESFDHVPWGGASPNVRQVTAAPAITHNIYCEQPYCSADGQRVALLRYYRLGPGATAELLVYDIPTLRLSLLARDVVHVATSAWSGVLFASVQVRRGFRLTRVDLNTLDCTDLFSLARLTPLLLPVLAPSAKAIYLSVQCCKPYDNRRITAQRID